MTSICQLFVEHQQRHMDTAKTQYVKAALNWGSMTIKHERDLTNLVCFAYYGSGAISVNSGEFRLGYYN